MGGAKAKAAPIEIIDAGGRSLGDFGGDGKPVGPNASFTNDENAGILAKEARKAAELRFDAGVEARLAARREADRDRATRELNLNSVRPAAEARSTGGNQVESDEVFTASKADRSAAVPPVIEQRYSRVGDKYFERSNPAVLAFEDKGNRLETRSSNEQIAESMVMIARARGWDEIKVAGSEAFRKEAWLEAAAHGMHVKGYTPSEQDKAELAKRSLPEAKRVDREATSLRAADGPESDVKPATREPSEASKRAAAFAQHPPAQAVTAYPELAGAYAVAAAIDRKAEADGLSAEQRAAVAARVRRNITNSIERGDIPAVRLKEQVEVRRENEREDTQELSR